MALECAARGEEPPTIDFKNSSLDEIMKFGKAAEEYKAKWDAKKQAEGKMPKKSPQKYAGPASKEEQEWLDEMKASGRLWVMNGREAKWGEKKAEKKMPKKSPREYSGPEEWWNEMKACGRLRVVGRSEVMDMFAKIARQD